MRLYMRRASASPRSIFVQEEGDAVQAFEAGDVDYPKNRSLAEGYELKPLIVIELAYHSDTRSLASREISRSSASMRRSLLSKTARF